MLATGIQGLSSEFFPRASIYFFLRCVNLIPRLTGSNLAMSASYREAFFRGVQASLQGRGWACPGPRQPAAMKGVSFLSLKKGVPEKIEISVRSHFQYLCRQLKTGTMGKIRSLHGRP